MPQTPGTPPRRGLRAFLLDLFASPWVPAALAVLAPVGGFWAAVQLDPIKQSVAALFPPLRTDTVFGPHIAFAVLVLILLGLGIGWVVHRYADAKKIAEKQKEIVAAQGKLESLQQRLQKQITYAQALGLDRALDEFRESIEGAFDAFLLVAASSRRHERHQVVRAIRVVLGYFASFCRAIDQAGPGSVYTAALLLFHGREELNAMEPAERNALLTEPAFYFYNELSVDPGQLSGVLEQRQELSTSTLHRISRGAHDVAPPPQAGPPAQSGEGADRPVAGKHAEWDIDPTAASVVLPVPDPERARVADGGTTFWGCLPGAPCSALTRSGHELFESIARVHEWMEKNSSLGQNVRLRLMQFFSPTGPGATVQSFLTVPIVHEKQLLGVVSITRATPGLLADGRDRIVVNAASPLLHFLAFLIACYKAAARRKEG